MKSPPQKKPRWEWFRTVDWAIDVQAALWLALFFQILPNTVPIGLFPLQFVIC